MIYTVTLNPAVDKELVVPAIEVDKVLRSREARLDFGGKGFNVSRMLISLGRDSVAMGFAGGHNGEILRDGLESLTGDARFAWDAYRRFVQAFGEIVLGAPRERLHHVMEQTLQPAQIARDSDL